jgi:hypothetical protein
MKQGQIRKPLNQKATINKNVDLKLNTDVGTSAFFSQQTSPDMVLNDAKFS